MQAGQPAVTMTYDGRGRRVKKVIDNSGQGDATYKYYHDQESLVETRNGSDQAVKHQGRKKVTSTFFHTAQFFC